MILLTIYRSTFTCLIQFVTSRVKSAELLKAIFASRLWITGSVKEYIRVTRYASSGRPYMILLKKLLILVIWSYWSFFSHIWESKRHLRKTDTLIRCWGYIYSYLALAVTFLSPLFKVALQPRLKGNSAKHKQLLNEITANWTWSLLCFTKFNLILTCLGFQ